jgi:hypothetical protein
MSDPAAIASACLVLALACAVGALRCLADHLLASAALYTLVALGLMAGAAGTAIHSL